MDKFCFTCKHWQGDWDKVKKALAENPESIRWQEVGECKRIFRKIQVNVSAGWDGGYAESIETEPSFSCNLWEQQTA